MSNPSTQWRRYEWALNNTKMHSAMKTPIVKVSGPRRNRWIPKGILLYLAPKWRWHLNDSSVRTVRVQDLPQPQLDFVLDWMLDGGERFDEPACGLWVPDADVPTMDLLLGFVETLGVKPLGDRVRVIRNIEFLKLSPEQQALQVRGNRGIDFLIASTGDTVETYVFGVRSPARVTPIVGNGKSKEDVRDKDAVLKTAMKDNGVSGKEGSTENKFDNKATNKEVIQSVAVGKVVPPICPDEEKNIVMMMLTSSDEKGNKAEEADLTTNTHTTGEGLSATDSLATTEDVSENESATRHPTTEEFLADDAIREQMAAEQVEADHFAAQELASDILAADFLSADLAEEENTKSQQASAWEVESERLAIETHNHLNPNRKMEAPSPSAFPSSRTHPNASITNQKKKQPDSNLNLIQAKQKKKSEEEELRKAEQLSIEAKASIPYRCSNDTPPTMETELSSNPKSNPNLNQQQKEAGNIITGLKPEDATKPPATSIPSPSVETPLITAEASKTEDWCVRDAPATNDDSSSSSSSDSSGGGMPRRRGRKGRGRRSTRRSRRGPAEKEGKEGEEGRYEMSGALEEEEELAE